MTNKIYVANQCGDDPNCGSTTMTVIDGASLPPPMSPSADVMPHLPSRSIRRHNKIYVPGECFGDPSCDQR